MNLACAHALFVSVEICFSTELFEFRAFGSVAIGSLVVWLFVVDYFQFSAVYCVGIF